MLRQKAAGLPRGLFAARQVNEFEFDEQAALPDIEIIVRDEPDERAALPPHDRRPFIIVGERHRNLPDLHRPDDSVLSDIGGVDDREDRREDRGEAQPPVNEQNAAVG